jgi:hypothetical protein
MVTLYSLIHSSKVICLCLFNIVLKDPYFILTSVMIYKFSVLSRRFSNFLIFTCIILMFFPLGLFAAGYYILGTLIFSLLLLTPITLDYTCESNFDKGVYIFRINYLLLSLTTETYNISNFNVYAYKKQSKSYRNNKGLFTTYYDTTLKVFDSKRKIRKTIAVGDESDVKKVINILKRKGYTWKKVIL